MKPLPLPVPVAMALIFLAVPDRAPAQVEYVITHAGRSGADGPVAIDLLIVNNDGEQRQIELPEHISALAEGGTDRTVWLEKVPEIPARVTLAPGSFARVRFDIADRSLDLRGALISVPGWRTQRVAFADDGKGNDLAAAGNARRAAAAPVEADEESGARDGSVQSRNERRINSFLGNFSAYEPSYIVFGTASDSEWRVQASFKYRVMGSREGRDGGSRWSDGLYLGFTQKLFWNIASDASFRDVNYLPELFYRTRAMSVDSKLQLGFQAGVQHESNGKSGDDGRSANNVYISPMALFDLGGGYSFSIAPRYTVLIGGRAGNPDIMDYRGRTSLNLQIGKDDGLRLTNNGRYNFSTGKGALQSELSYPLTRIFGGAPNFYLFGQVFTGYGESLLDYNRRMTRLRVGVAITR